MSWRQDPDSRLWALFDVMAETDGYVSVGLSEDKKMVRTNIDALFRNFLMHCCIFFEFEFK